MSKLEVNEGQLWQVAKGIYYNPHEILGIHKNTKDNTWTIRVSRKWAKRVLIEVIVDSRPQYIELENEYDNIWSTVVPKKIEYKVLATYSKDDKPLPTLDPYTFLPTISDLDLYLITQGRNEKLWNSLGFNTVESEGIWGVRFSVWAPNAKAVRVVSNFNFWDGETLSMRSLGGSGVWELFIPNDAFGQSTSTPFDSKKYNLLYQFEIICQDGHSQRKADPLAKFCETAPNNASIGWTSSYIWEDKEFIENREKLDPTSSPVSIYEVHLGSWKKGLNYKDLASELVNYVKDLGFNYVEFMPLAQYPFEGSWGYQVTGYYAPDSRLGNPDDFKFLVDSFHKEGIGVIMDWVPAHFPKDSFSLGQFDGTALYEDPNPKRGNHPDWGTYIFNYGRWEVRNFLVSNALYWMEEYHLDGLRVDAVASMLYLDYSRNEGEWEPNIFGGNYNLEAIDFIKEANTLVYKNNKGVMMIAEESTAFSGVTKPVEYDGLGFGFKWNMGWMNDTIGYIQRDPIYRQYHQNDLTFSFLYSFSEHFVLPFSHDEVVHGKGSLISKIPGDLWQKFAGLRTLLLYQFTHSGKNLLFMGCEFGQWSEWNYNYSLDWGTLMSPNHKGIQDFVRDLNNYYLKSPTLWELDDNNQGYRGLKTDDAAANIFIYYRKSKEGKYSVVVLNFANFTHQNYKVPFPKTGIWKEVINSDNLKYGGSGVKNSDIFVSSLEPVQDNAHTWYNAEVKVPSLGSLIFELDE